MPSAAAGLNSTLCSGAATSTRECVANYTQKVEGDDTEHIMDVFESFLDEELRSSDAVAIAKPFLAVLWLHSMHKPHPALPQYFHNYTDAFGDPAGDYLGTLTQMDVQIGRLRQMLKDKGIANNTLLW